MQKELTELNKLNKLSIDSFDNREKAKKYECPICFNIMLEIYAVDLCGHLFCDECILMLDKCPYCHNLDEINNSTKKEFKYHKAVYLIRRLNNKIVKCPNCDEETILSNLNKHNKEKHFNLIEIKETDAVKEDIERIERIDMEEIKIEIMRGTSLTDKLGLSSSFLVSILSIKILYDILSSYDDLFSIFIRICLLCCFNILRIIGGSFMANIIGCKWTIGVVIISMFIISLEFKTEVKL